MRALFIILIVVVYSSCSSINPSQLERTVKYALGRDARTSQSSFDVSYQGAGEVMVSGDVSSERELEAVTEVAKTVHGVTSVVNKCNSPPSPENLIRESLIPSKGD